MTSLIWVKAITAPLTFRKCLLKKKKKKKRCWYMYIFRAERWLTSWPGHKPGPFKLEYNSPGQICWGHCPTRKQALISPSSAGMSLHSLFTRQQVNASHWTQNEQQNMSKYDEAEVTVQVLGLCKHPNAETMLAILGGGLLGGFCCWMGPDSNTYWFQLFCAHLSALLTRWMGFILLSCGNNNSWKDRGRGGGGII